MGGRSPPVAKSSPGSVAVGGLLGVQGSVWRIITASVKTSSECEGAAGCERTPGRLRWKQQMDAYRGYWDSYSNEDQ